MNERRIIFMLGFALVLMFCANLILANKLRKIADGFVCATYADSVEGLKVSDMFKDGVIFIAPSKLCESCIISAVSDLIKSYGDSLKLFRVNVYLILERENLVLINFFQEQSLLDFLKIEINPNYVKSIKYNLEQGLCVFISNGRVIYASPITNYKVLKAFYRKVINYLSESTYF